MYKQHVLIAIILLLFGVSELCSQTLRTIEAGVPVCITITATDSNGVIIQDWDTIGEDGTITLYNSTANIDTSQQSWTADPTAFSYAYFTHKGIQVTQVTERKWKLHRSYFEDGIAEICFISTKADTGVYFIITPEFSPVHFVSDQYNFVPCETSYLTVDITWPKVNQHAVYLWREYEFVVTPRDEYTNISNDTLWIHATANFPGEFVSGRPGFGDEWPAILNGITLFNIGSIKKRQAGSEDLQEIFVWSLNDSTLRGSTGEYEVLPHAPGVFELLYPPDDTTLMLMGFSVPAEFLWDESIDPYTNIKISAFNDEIASDVVTYMICMVDSTNLTQKVSIDSDNLGLEPLITLTHGQLLGVAKQLTQDSLRPIYPVYWYVEATDGLYITQNRPANTAQHQLARLLRIDLTWNPDTGFPPPELAEIFTLHQNFPNPFGRSIENSRTTIKFETVKRNHVSLKVYDVLGHEVATIVDEILEPGVYQKWFVSRNLPAGVYHYTLVASGKMITKSMVIAH